MKLLATADLHIQKEEDAALLERIMKKAEEQSCSAVLIGGDLLESPFPDAAAEQAIFHILEAHPLPVYLAAGNHDPLAVTPLYRNLPPQVHLFPEEPAMFPLAEKIRLFGYSAAREQEDRNPLAHFRAPGDGVNILLAHGQPDGGAASFLPVSGARLATSGLKLAILGHIHKAEQREIGGCRLLVPGIPQGRGWDEMGEKSVYLIEIDPSGGILIEPCCVAERVYREYRVDVTRCEDSMEILNRMEQVVIPENTVARLVLTGCPLVNPEAAARVYTEQHNRPVRDETDPSLSIELLLEQNTLQGAFVRRAMAEIEQASPEERPALEEALKIGLKALKEAKL